MAYYDDHIKALQDAFAANIPIEKKIYLGGENFKWIPWINADGTNKPLEAIGLCPSYYRIAETDTSLAKIDEVLANINKEDQKQLKKIYKAFLHGVPLQKSIPGYKEDIWINVSNAADKTSQDNLLADIKFSYNKYRLLK